MTAAHVRVLEAVELSAGYTASARRLLAQLAELQRGAVAAGEDRGRAIAVGDYPAALEAHARAGIYLKEIGALQARVGDLIAGIGLAQRETGRALAGTSIVRHGCSMS